MYLLDNMLSYGKPFTLDWAIPQEEGLTGSQVTSFQLWHDRVVVSRHGNACLIKSEYKPVKSRKGKPLYKETRLKACGAQIELRTHINIAEAC